MIPFMFGRAPRSLASGGGGGVGAGGWGCGPPRRSGRAVLTRRRLGNTAHPVLRCRRTPATGISWPSEARRVFSCLARRDGDDWEVLLILSSAAGARDSLRRTLAPVCPALCQDPCQPRCGSRRDPLWILGGSRTFSRDHVLCGPSFRSGSRTTNCSLVKLNNGKGMRCVVLHVPLAAPPAF